MKKIVLLCAAGMSTSLLVNKMKEAAAKEGYDSSIAAYPVSDIEKHKDADVILLGPQVGYQKTNFQKKYPELKLDIIDMRMYGMMDGKAVLEQAKKLMES